MYWIVFVITIGPPKTENSKQTNNNYYSYCKRPAQDTIESGSTGTFKVYEKNRKPSLLRIVFWYLKWYT